MPYVGKKPADIIATSIDTTTGTFSGDIDASTVNATGDTAAGDNAAIGFTSAEGLILTGQGSTSDITVKNDADATVFTVPTGTDDILFPDSAEIQMGAGVDLKVFSDGTNGVLRADNGRVYIQTDTGVNLTKTGNAETMLIATPDGAVDLYHNNSKKFETTSSGIDVTGTIEADDKVTIAYETGSSDWELESTSGDDFKISRNGSQQFIIDGSTSMFGMGITTPDAKLHLISGDADTQIKIQSAVSANATSSLLMMSRRGGAENQDVTIKATSGNLSITGDSGYGKVLVGTTDTSPVTNDELGISLDGGNNVVQISRDNVSLELNRKGSDGAVVSIRQAGTTEGQISVSGTTVTYGGGHLGRLSRLLDNSKDTTIVKGTVMTNLDEMVEWKHEDVLWTEDDELPVYEKDDTIPDGKSVGDAKVSIGDVKKSAYTEDNEQLNKMAVSSIEGDANVSGVFVSWDDDDDFKDMMIAMTGDMVIRIAKDTTVARGDLLMSAGDGTAKPQGDDIVRSKTIAKVTSTNKSHTYDDGTYLVPCVLMAC